MLNDLDETLKAFLKQELPSSLVEQITISFAIPDAQFANSVARPAIDLFLYDIRENLDLRRNDWRIDRRSDGSAAKVAPATRVDCAYLITAWPRESTPNPAQDEHYLLGEVMKALLRHRKIPVEMLQGSLVGQDPPLRAAVLQDSRLQSVGEFWQAVGGQPKAALNYSLTISVDVVEPVEMGRLVSQSISLG